MSQKSPNDSQDLLAVIQQAAIGLIVANKAGDIRHMNQMAEMMVMPLFQRAQVAPTNILTLLEMIAPGVANKVESFPEPQGFVITQQKQTVEMEHEGQKMVRHFFYSINKVSDESIVYSFDDITNYHEAQEEVARLNQEVAIDRSKFEMAAGVLHDIGNAVVGFGSQLTKIRRSLEENDLETLAKLKKFLETQEGKLAEGIGEAKTKALISLVDGLRENQANFHQQIQKSVKEQMGIASHISDILNIQRQYVAGGESRPREQVNLRSVVYDALAILLASFEKRSIKINSNIPEEVPTFLGDRTKLIQVVLNLLKNAIDAIDDNPKSDKNLDLALKVAEGNIILEISDSGIGFDQKQAEQHFSRGFTTKKQGTGLGLSSGKSVAESHNGSLTLKSDGIGQGAMATLSIPLQQESK